MHRDSASRPRRTGRGGRRGGEPRPGLLVFLARYRAACGWGAAVQTLARDFEYFERDIAQLAAAMRRFQPEKRHVAPHRLALLLGPVGDEIAGGIERGIVVQKPDP